jgi:homoaconitase/3-isopropylmalate dehydratase large subunit
MKKTSYAFFVLPIFLSSVSAFATNLSPSTRIVDLNANSWNGGIVRRYPGSNAIKILGIIPQAAYAKDLVLLVGAICKFTSVNSAYDTMIYDNSVPQSFTPGHAYGISGISLEKGTITIQAKNSYDAPSAFYLVCTGDQSLTVGKVEADLQNKIKFY